MNQADQRTKGQLKHADTKEWTTETCRDTEEKVGRSNINVSVAAEEEEGAEQIWDR